MDAAIATTGSGRADQSGGFPHRSHADHDRAGQLSRAGEFKFQCRQQNPKKPLMSTFIKSTIIALALAAGTTSASADPLLDELASKGAIITTFGIRAPR
jgi:hypothetical protein